LKKIKIKGLDELNLNYDSSSTGTAYVNQSVTTEGSICSIQSWSRTADLVMSAVTGHANMRFKIPNPMDDEMHELYGSEEENNISEVPWLMNMRYEVEATQFIQPTVIRQSGRDLHPSMMRLNWDYGIHLPETFDEVKMVANKERYAGWQLTIFQIPTLSCIQTSWI
jgi:hypothetical protein